MPYNFSHFSGLSHSCFSLLLSWLWRMTSVMSALIGHDDAVRCFHFYEKFKSLLSGHQEAAMLLSFQWRHSVSYGFTYWSWRYSMLFSMKTDIGFVFLLILMTQCFHFNEEWHQLCFIYWSWWHSVVSMNNDVNDALLWWRTMASIIMFPLTCGWWHYATCNCMET